MASCAPNIRVEICSTDAQCRELPVSSQYTFRRSSQRQVLGCAAGVQSPCLMTVAPLAADRAGTDPGSRRHFSFAADTPANEKRHASKDGFIRIERV